MPKHGNVDKDLKKELDKQERERLLFKANDLLPKEDVDKKLEQFQLISGEFTTVDEEWQKRFAILSDEMVIHKPKFSEFLRSFAVLDNWDEKTKKAYRKPIIVPKIINDIYSRFPPEAKKHIQEKNPYFKWFLRKYKNYYFFGDNGIAILEIFISEAVVLMKDCDSSKDFRAKYAIKYGVGFQLDMFMDYIKTI